ncbi:MAG: RNA 3'-terminal phosphate cyclase [Candidatus Aenigmarchaeota archaeon]|nr:RNA 3'-terminal phosphate cyclase [Candidatus Aenigmarchaeota archaeon]
MMEIPGDYGSGSGTIVRLSLAFSALTNTPIRITDIRAKRPNPGLRHQHLEAVRTIAKISLGRLIGDYVGSKTLEFYPKRLKGGKIDVSIETAGSIGLLAYAALIPSVFSQEDVILNIKGGSIASMWSPPVPYMTNVLLPALSKMGIQAKITIEKYGFYPRGGSAVVLAVKPSRRISPLNLTDFGAIKNIRCVSISSKLLRKANVAERQVIGAMRILKKQKIEKEVLYVDSACPGSMLLLTVETTSGLVLGSDSIGERGKPAEVIGEEAAFKLQEIIKYKPTLDEHLSDQLIPFMALANGKSEVIIPEITDHVKTNIWLCEKFLGTKFEMEEEGENIRISCAGK